MGPLISAHPADCPEFDYEHHVGWQPAVKARVAQVLVDLASGTIDTRATALDTRQVHRFLFHELTPRDCDYFAGHYRGENFKCLRHYAVGVQDDNRLGAPASSVAWWMSEVSAKIGSAIAALESDRDLSARDRLRYLIVLVSNVFELVLRIHPYANGNGHSARFLVWCLLGRYGHWPVRFSIDPRPAGPDYITSIKKYRDGDKGPLEAFILSSLAA